MIKVYAEIDKMIKEVEEIVKEYGFSFTLSENSVQLAKSRKHEYIMPKKKLQESEDSYSFRCASRSFGFDDNFHGKDGTKLALFSQTIMDALIKAKKSFELGNTENGILKLLDAIKALPNLRVYNEEEVKPRKKGGHGRTGWRKKGGNKTEFNSEVADWILKQDQAYSHGDKIEDAAEEFAKVEYEAKPYFEIKYNTLKRTYTEIALKKYKNSKTK